MDEKYKKLEKACRDLIKLYRDSLFNGFVAAHRIKEWVVLCELLDEPTESQPQAKEKVNEQNDK